MFFVKYVCWVGFEPPKKVVHYKREPDGSMAVNPTRVDESSEAKIKFSPIPSPATRVYTAVHKGGFFVRISTLTKSSKVKIKKVAIFRHF